MPKEFIMKGQLASSGSETLRLSGIADGYGYIITSFQIAPSTNLGSAGAECFAAITSATSAMDPINPNWDTAGLVATATSYSYGLAVAGNFAPMSLIDDMTVLTQDLILSVRETDNGNPVNYLIKFKEVKLTGAAEAVANYKQYGVYNTSQ
jgi:hypothetical protein